MKRLKASSGQSGIPKLLIGSVVSALLLVACGSTQAAPSEVVQPSAPFVSTTFPTLPSDAGSFRVESVVKGLEVPWDMAFAPDGRLFITERPGRIRVVDDQLLETPFAELNVWRRSEAGLMGIALDPAFADNSFVYVCYTYLNSRNDPTNRVARLTDFDGVGIDHTVVIDDIAGARNHNGCRIRFGPDGKLYITTGDAQNSVSAQAINSLSGKVLRINPDGSIPADNPFPGSPVYTLGHRNPQGIAWHPVTGEAFITEHGPFDNDEVNRLIAGKNYGWPIVRGAAGSEEFEDAVVAYTPTLAVSGATFYTGGPLPDEWVNNFFFTTLKAAHLHRIKVETTVQGETRVTVDEVVLGEEYGRLRSVVEGPDGFLYITTSNRDGRGQPSANDDQVLRMVPDSG